MYCLQFLRRKKQSAVILSQKMDSPEQREEELEKPADGVDAVQGLDALPQLQGYLCPILASLCIAAILLQLQLQQPTKTQRKSQKIKDFCGTFY